MKFLTLLSIIGVLYSCKRNHAFKKEILLEAFSEDTTVTGNNYKLTVFEDSTCLESYSEYRKTPDNIYIYVMDSLVEKSFSTIIKEDTLIFNNRMGLLKNGYLEIIKDGKTVNRLLIKKSKIIIPYHFDIKRFPRYHQFFGSELEKPFFKEKYGPYHKIDLNTYQITTFDSLINALFLTHEDFKHLRFKDYYVQFLPVKTTKNTIFVQAVLLCEADRAKYYMTYIHDGGDCIIELEADLSNKKIIEFFIHGM